MDDDQAKASAYQTGEINILQGHQVTLRSPMKVRMIENS